MERIQYFSLTDQVYDVLKHRIIGHELAPNEKLDVNGLAQQLGVSRMPVVDALTRLETEGLVEKRNRVGTFVTPINHRMFEELFEMRSMIEDWATPKIIAKMTAQDCKRIADLLKEGRRRVEGGSYDTFDLKTFTDKYDDDFHAALVHCAGNDRITETYSGLRAHIRIGRAFIKPEEKLSAARRSQDFHDKIWKAFLAEDVSLARKLQEQHRRDSLDSILVHLKD